MSFKPLPPLRGMSGTGTIEDDASVISGSTQKSQKPSAKTVWCETQWTNLSIQAKNLGLSTMSYFDPRTMLLSKEVNVKLWNQLVKLYGHLGPEKAPFATPVMIEGGEVKWYSYLDGHKGEEAEIYDR